MDDLPYIDWDLVQSSAIAVSVLALAHISHISEVFSHGLLKVQPGQRLATVFEVITFVVILESSQPHTELRCAILSLLLAN